MADKTLVRAGRQTDPRGHQRLSTGAIDYAVLPPQNQSRKPDGGSIMARWFRFYAEVVNDPKVQLLPCEDFRAWVNLLCLASENDGKLPSFEAISFALRIDVTGVATVVERLSNGGLIDRLSGGPDGYHYAPHGWDKRQYKSDTSTERVKRFRERSETVTVTPPETEADTESESKRVTNVTLVRSSDLFPEFWAAYPLKKGKPAAKAAYTKALKETDHATLVAAVHTQRRWPEWSEPRYIPHASTWLNKGRWADEPAGGSGAGMAGNQKTNGNGSRNTSVADIAARRRRERESGMEIPGGKASLSGHDLGWDIGAISGQRANGDWQG